MNNTQKIPNNLFFQDFSESLEPFDDIFSKVEDISTISFELLLPKKPITQSTDVLSTLAPSLYTVEELLTRQNLVDIAIKENTLIKENDQDFTNLLIKYEQDFYSQEFIKNINQMTKDDIEFFEILSSEKLVQLNNTVSILIKSEDKTETREVRFSKSLQNLLEYAFLTNKPIRLDFAKNLTIILQIDTAGMVSAQFISREKAMDTILKNNLPLLKKKLDSSKIKYKKISYKKKQPQGEYHE